MISTVYDERFWSVERHWKVADTPLTSMFGGTPFKNVISRMLGCDGRQDGVRRWLWRHREDPGRNSATTAH